MKPKCPINIVLLVFNLCLFVAQYLVFMSWSGLKKHGLNPSQNLDDDVFVYNAGLNKLEGSDKSMEEKQKKTPNCEISQSDGCNITWNWNWDGREDTKVKVNRFLYLVRHGQYYGNGPYEKHLSPLGHIQATKVAKKLKSWNITFTRFISSTSIRAAETADIIHQFIDYLNVEYSDQLKEGWPAYPEPASPGLWNKNDQIFANDVPRLKDAFDKYIHRADSGRETDSNEIIVVHGNVISYAVLRSLQVPISRWLRIAVLQGSITLIQIYSDGKVDIRFVGDVGHLAKQEWSG
ncbi:hypothetical protein LSH36_11g06062 [Paralvinella palmiformis]|uniref:Serine/threonine-protein phosphatase PGAM5, mitochondrial n=1 Tax=Paralvinella palmiformis TaxID=53620 RepID=A0AAD9KDI5_9ANNE|nr:hypothetical protein LSH36_11g06062 [Paralvinella palmiformis]